MNIALGIDEQSLTWWQMSIRAVGVFFAALIIIRIGKPRIFGKYTAFDIILGIIYGSVLSRAITGNAPFWPTILAALVLVLLHGMLAAIAFKTSFGFGNFIKGKPIMLVQKGCLQHDAMKQASITKNDLREAMRKSGKDNSLNEIETAYLERSGDISIIFKEKSN